MRARRRKEWYSLGVISLLKGADGLVFCHDYASLGQDHLQWMFKGFLGFHKVLEASPLPLIDLHKLGFYTQYRGPLYMAEIAHFRKQAGSCSEPGFDINGN